MDDKVPGLSGTSLCTQYCGLFYRALQVLAESLRLDEKVVGVSCFYNLV